MCKVLALQVGWGSKNPHKSWAWWHTSITTLPWRTEKRKILGTCYQPNLVGGVRLNERPTLKLRWKAVGETLNTDSPTRLYTPHTQLREIPDVDFWFPYMCIHVPPNPQTTYTMHRTLFFVLLFYYLVEQKQASWPRAQTWKDWHTHLLSGHCFWFYFL